ncbi:hypothetical protein GCM10007386_45430 [Pseudoduganella dura]|nr:hypothetical protein GCM10007386_45430 [Pseudoduganella dura]
MFGVIAEGADNAGRALGALRFGQCFQCLLPAGFQQFLPLLSACHRLAVLVFETDEHGAMDEAERGQIVERGKLVAVPGNREPRGWFPVLWRLVIPVFEVPQDGRDKAGIGAFAFGERIGSGEPFGDSGLAAYRNQFFRICESFGSRYFVLQREICSTKCLLEIVVIRVFPSKRTQRFDAFAAGKNKYGGRVWHGGDVIAIFN